MRQSIAVGMTSYNRPLFLKEAVQSLHRNPGREFKFFLWDNNSNEETKALSKSLAKQYDFKVFFNGSNIGSDGMEFILKETEAEYFVLTEDDMMWFQDGWLDNLVKGFEQAPQITEQGRQIGFKDEWGILGTNVLVDEVNNGGMWPSRLFPLIEYQVNGISYWANIRAGGGAQIFKTEILKTIPLAKSKYLNQFMFQLIDFYEKQKYPMGNIRDTYIYHACSPFYNQLYKEVFAEKQHGKESIEQEFEKFNKTGLFKFEGKEWILDILKQGHFQEYARQIYEKNTGHRQ